MDTNMVFNLLSLFALIVLSLTAAWYVWPKIKQLSYPLALVPLLLFSSIRYLGAALLVPEWTNNLSEEYARAVGYGDIIAAVLALLAAFTLRRSSKAGIPMAWAYAIFGTIDTLYVLSLMNKFQVPQNIGALWPMPVLVGPAVLVATILLWITLIKKPKAA